MRRTPASPNPPQEPAALHVRLETGKVEEALRGLAEELTRTKAGTATVDMTEILSLDTAGLHALTILVKAAQTAGTELRCAAVRPRIYKALHLAKLGTRISRVASPPRALGEPTK